MKTKFSKKESLPKYMIDALSNLEALPSALRDKLTKMGTKDQEIAKLISQAEAMTSNYCANVKTMTRPNRRTTKSTIKKLHKKSCSLSDQKVDMAKKLSEMIDNHIEHLDEALSQYEEDFHAKMRTQSFKKTDNTETERNSNKSKFRRSNNSANSLGRTTSRKPLLLTHSILKHPLTTPPSGNEGMSTGVSFSAHNPLDMPVDPHEPTYCICHNVCYGEMVGCDNPDCLVEWFHFGCVGLDEQPEGKWFCPRCTDLMPFLSDSPNIEAGSSKQKVLRVQGHKS